MERARIRKSHVGGTVVPNLVDYDEARRSFSWERARAALEGLPEGRGLNIAHEAVDRHASGPRASRIALRCVGLDGTRRDVSIAGGCESVSRRSFTAPGGVPEGNP